MFFVLRRIRIVPWRDRVLASNPTVLTLDLQFTAAAACPKPKRANQLEMFSAVQADLDEHPFEFTWQELMSRWNAKRLKRRYKDYRQFAKDFKLAAAWVKRVLVNPRFAVFKDSFWWANVDSWPELPPAIRGRKRHEP